MEETKEETVEEDKPTKRVTTKFIKEYGDQRRQRIMDIKEREKELTQRFHDKEREGLDPLDFLAGTTLEQDDTGQKHIGYYLPEGLVAVGAGPVRKEDKIRYAQLQGMSTKLNKKGNATIFIGVTEMPLEDKLDIIYASQYFESFDIMIRFALTTLARDILKNKGRVAKPVKMTEYEPILQHTKAIPLVFNLVPPCPYCNSNNTARKDKYKPFRGIKIEPILLKKPRYRKIIAMCLDCHKEYYIEYDFRNYSFFKHQCFSNYQSIQTIEELRAVELLNNIIEEIKVNELNNREPKFVKMSEDWKKKFAEIRAQSKEIKEQQMTPLMKRVEEGLKYREEMSNTDKFKVAMEKTIDMMYDSDINNSKAVSKILEEIKDPEVKEIYENLDDFDQNRMNNTILSISELVYIPGKDKKYLTQRATHQITNVLRNIRPEINVTKRKTAIAQARKNRPFKLKGKLYKQVEYI
jgi:hypothetical protein